MGSLGPLMKNRAYRDDAQMRRNFSPLPTIARVDVPPRAPYNEKIQSFGRSD